VEQTLVDGSNALDNLQRNFELVLGWEYLKPLVKYEELDRMNLTISRDDHQCAAVIQQLFFSFTIFLHERFRGSGFLVMSGGLVSQWSQIQV